MGDPGCQRSGRRLFRHARHRRLASIRPHAERPLLLRKAMNSRTVFQLLEESAAKYGKAAALHQPYQENGQRQNRTYSWQEYRQAALEIAAGLRAMGIRKGDVVALDSETRAEFYLADLGI